MMLHFRDRRGVAQRRFATEITLLVCEKSTSSLMLFLHTLTLSGARDI